jgi:hypothetical protein
MDWEEIIKTIVVGICAILAIPVFFILLWGTISIIGAWELKCQAYEAQTRLEIAKIEAQMPAKKGCEG